ncbi:hypothetical protein EGR_03289 [Echinococcus granulosus]|uniref:Uncharacterized protein n=1 Tax=Echinococcus granulosus TaxID=6210 RepID=W6UKZ2_ECHGR|nr:hypothetical protein EGR_03289 [Echinococcus granulosus]EUB61743.1 hypothetical protein EGR_03289 [Echinococcus granulosus]
MRSTQRKATRSNADKSKYKRCVKWLSNLQACSSPLKSHSPGSSDLAVSPGCEFQQRWATKDLLSLEGITGLQGLETAPKT